MMPLASRSLLLDIAPAGERLVVVGERGHVLYSDDAGTTWRQASVPTTQMLTAVYFISRKRGWAVGHDGLVLATDDAGANWYIQRDGLAVQRTRDREERDTARAIVKNLEESLTAASGPQREALQTRLEDARLELADAEETLQNPVFAPPLMDVWFQDLQRGWAVGAFGLLLVTSDGGEHWADRPHLVDNPEEYHLNAITGDGSGRLLVAGENGLVYRSLDAGDHWESLDPIYAGSWFGALCSGGGSRLLVFGLRGHLYRSDDFGESWEAVPTEIEATLAGGTVVAGGQIAIAGSVGTVLISRDGGLSFSTTSVPDRLSLSSALLRDGRLTVVGQGGVRSLRAEGDNE